MVRFAGGKQCTRRVTEGGPDLGDVFETTDAELAEHVLRESYGGGMRLDTRGRHGGIRLDQARLTPSVRLDHLNFSLSFDVRANPLGVWSSPISAPGGSLMASTAASGAAGRET